MQSPSYPAIRFFLDHFNHDSKLAELGRSLEQLFAGQSPQYEHEIADLYQRAIPLIEDNIWTSAPDESMLQRYQALFRELERLLEACGSDQRHSFIIVIPIADRPLQLEQCLGSLHRLCQLYEYGGFDGSRYKKIRVIVADDSADPTNMEKHRDICNEFSTRGVSTDYFGIHDQIEAINKIPGTDLKALHHILGRYCSNPDASDFSHKGASITRNITYLHLNRIIGDAAQKKTLIHFIDSDQEFRIKLHTGNGYRDAYAINYFYHMNSIFECSNAKMLTGKVVGDPPVSPAVMAANFQEDLIGFLNQIAGCAPSVSCQFHGDIEHASDEAVYHDMADLFGFRQPDTNISYQCELKQTHDNRDCFADFGKRLKRFFDGEHPTRVTSFEYRDGFNTTTPARTVYTGNYVFRPECLRYFIAFATLGLRMAGPTLGRIIKSELGDAFVSANLPMLHKRTVQATGTAECRPGVEHDSDTVDLSGEFERQYYGDIMLFTIDKLTALGYPESQLSTQDIQCLLDETITDMHKLYEEKHRKVVDRLQQLKTVFFDTNNWWQNQHLNSSTREDYVRFIHNIERNFGDNSNSHLLINSIERRDARKLQILQAIERYADDRASWATIIR